MSARRHDKAKPDQMGSRSGFTETDMNITSSSSYHSSRVAKPSRPYEFIGVDTTDLEHDVGAFLRLRERLQESDEPEPIRSNSIVYIDTFLERAVRELEWRRKRAKRSTHTPASLRWAFRSRYDEMAALAQELKHRLSIAEYLDRYVLWAVLTPSGDRLRGRCPFPDHDDSTASFVVYPDDLAWCFGCHKGGDLFRVVALIEGIQGFRDQLQYVVDLVEPLAQETIE